MNGNDTLHGMTGDDTFAFQDGFGKDSIEGFNISQVNERITLVAISLITGFTDLSNNHLSQSGGDTVIDDGSGNAITLVGVNMGELVADDFVF